MKAAPAHFPYHHRTLAGHTDAEMLDRYEYCQRRFNAGLVNWREPDKRGLRLRKPVEIIHTNAVDRSPCEATDGAESATKRTAPESASTLDPRPDHNRLARGGD